ncbi:MAG: 4Fe-4S binding protein [Thermodesulfobacteriota bacterium]
MTDVYEKLRERLDMFPQGFPRTGSGVEIEVLQNLFSPEEAETALSLRPYPEEVSAVADRTGRDEEELAGLLYDMSKKGLILRGTVAGRTFYFLVPWMVGIWEFQVGRLDRENIELYERFFREGLVPERMKSKTAGFRVIPIERQITGGAEIQPFERVSQIIESSQRFAVADCICRKEARMRGEGCDKMLETCLVFDLAAQYYIENGLGREITREEAYGILQRAEESGLVHCSNNHMAGKMFICNCCGCCCKALGLITKYNHLLSLAKSNYYARIDAQTCTACETCLERCQVGALKMEDDAAVVDLERCIGCGLCVSTCPAESIVMVRKGPEESSPVFADQMALLQALGREKNKAWPFD